MRTVVNTNGMAIACESFQLHDIVLVSRERTNTIAYATLICKLLIVWRCAGLYQYTPLQKQACIYYSSIPRGVCIQTQRGVMRFLPTLFINWNFLAGRMLRICLDILTFHFSVVDDVFQRCGHISIKKFKN